MEQRGPHSPDPSVPEAPPEGTGSGSFARQPGGQRQEPREAGAPRPRPLLHQAAATAPLWWNLQPVQEKEISFEK